MLEDSRFVIFTFVPVNTTMQMALQLLARPRLNTMDSRKAQRVSANPAVAGCTVCDLAADETS